MSQTPTVAVVPHGVWQDEHKAWLANLTVAVKDFPEEPDVYVGPAIDAALMLAEVIKVKDVLASVLTCIPEEYAPEVQLKELIETLSHLHLIDSSDDQYDSALCFALIDIADLVKRLQYLLQPLGKDVGVEELQDFLRPYEQLIADPTHAAVPCFEAAKQIASMIKEISVEEAGMADMQRAGLVQHILSMAADLHGALKAIRDDLGWTRSGGAMSKAADGPLPEPECDTVRVYYATERKQVNRAEALALANKGTWGRFVAFLTDWARRHQAPDPSDAPAYNSDQKDTLSCGYLDVTIPRKVQNQAGHIVPRLPGGAALGSNRKYHITISNAMGSYKVHDSEAAFFKDLREDHRALKGLQVLLFVHGYNVTFDGAVSTAGQLAFDLGRMHGQDVNDLVPLAFDWASYAQTERYFQDAGRVPQAAKKLAEFLKQLLAPEHGQVTLQIVVHSMGNYVLSKALKLLSIEPSTDMTAGGIPRTVLDTVIDKISTTVFAAPDLHREKFSRMLDRLNPSAGMKPRGPQLTLYCSSSDYALWLSSNLSIVRWEGLPAKEHHRAGYFQAKKDPDGIIRHVSHPFFHASIDTVVASTFGTDGIILHGYYSNSYEVLQDMEQVVNKKIRARERRHTLAPCDAGDCTTCSALTYYRVRTSNEIRENRES